MAENGGVANFTPTAKPKGTWAIFLSSFVIYFLTRKSAGTPTRDLEFGREVAFPFVSSLLGNFAPAGLAMERVSTSVGDGAGEGAGNDVGNGAGNAVRSLPPPDA